MSITVLDEQIWFPPIEHALEDGLLAMGGDLSTERLIKKVFFHGTKVKRRFGGAPIPDL
jgi:hypothetical protein